MLTENHYEGQYLHLRAYARMYHVFVPMNDIKIYIAEYTDVLIEW